MMAVADDGGGANIGSLAKRRRHGESPPPLYTHSVVFCSPGEYQIDRMNCLGVQYSSFSGHPSTVGPQDFELLTVLGTGGIISGSLNTNILLYHSL